MSRQRAAVARKPGWDADREVAELEQSNYELKLKNFRLERNLADGYQGDVRGVISKNISLNNTLELSKSELEDRNLLLMKARSTIQNLQADMQALQMEQSVKLNDTRMVQSRLEQEAAARKQSEMQLQVYGGQLSAMQMRDAEHQRTVNDLRDALMEAQKDSENRVERSVHNDLIVKHNELKRELEAAKTLKTVLEHKEAQLGNTNKEVSALQQDVQQLVASLKQHQEQVDALTSENATLKAVTEQSRNVVDRLTDELERTRREVTETQTELSNGLVKKIKHALKRAEKETQAADALRTKLAVTEQALGDSRQMLRKQSEATIEAEQLRLEVHKLSHDLSLRQQESNAKTQRITELMSELKHSVPESEAAHAAKAEEQIRHLRGLLASKERELRDMEAEVVPKRQYNDTYSKLVHVENQLAMLTRGGDALNASFDLNQSLSEERGSLRAQLHRTEAELRRVTREAEDLRRNNNNTSLNGSFSLDAEFTENLQAQVRKSEGKIRMLENQLKNKDGELKGYKERFENSTAQLSEISERRAQLHAMEHNLRMREEEMKLRAQTLMAQTQASQHLLEQKEADNQAGAQQLAELHDFLAQSRADAAAMSNRLKEAAMQSVPKEEYARVSQQLEQVRFASELELRELSTKNQALQDHNEMLSRAQTDLEKLQIELSAKERDARMKQRQIDYLDDQVKQLEKINEQTQQEAFGLSNDNRNLETELANVTNRNGEQTIALETLRAEHQALVMECVDARGVLVHLPHAHELNPQDVVAHLKGSVKRLTEETAGLEAETQKAQAEVAGLQDRIGENERQFARDLMLARKERDDTQARMQAECEQLKQEAALAQDNLAREVNTLSNQLRASEQQLTALHAKAREYEQQTTETLQRRDAQIVELNHTKGRLQSELDVLRVKHQGDVDTIDKMKGDAQELILQLRDAKRELNDATLQIASLNTRVEMTTQATEEQRQRVVALTTELEQAMGKERDALAKAEANADHAKELQTRLNMAHAEMEMLKKDQSRFEIELEAAQRKHEVARGNQMRLQSRVDELQAMEAAREVRVNMAEEGRKSAELALSSETQRRQRFENEVKEMQQTIYGQQQKLDQARLVEEEKDRLQRENKHLAQKHEDDLKSLRKEYDGRTNELLEKNRLIQQKSDRNQADLEVANSKMWDLEQKTNKLERDATNASRELARQTEALEKEQTRNAKLHSANTALEEDVHRQKGDIRDLEREKEAEQQRRETTEKQLEQVTSERNDLKDNHRRVSDELRDIKKESELKHGKLTNELASKTQELDKAVTEYERRLNEKENALHAEAEALRNANGEIDNMSAKLGQFEQDLDNANKECDDLSNNLRDKIAELQSTVATCDDLRQKGQNKADILRRIVEVLDSMNLQSEDADGNYSAEMDVNLPDEFFTAENFDDIPDYLWDDALAWLQGKMNAFKRINRAFHATIEQCENKWITQYHKLEEELDVREDEVQVLERKLQELLGMIGGNDKRFATAASNARRRQQNSVTAPRPDSRAASDRAATDRYRRSGSSQARADLPSSSSYNNNSSSSYNNNNNSSSSNTRSRGGGVGGGGGGRGSSQEELPVTPLTKPLTKELPRRTDSRQGGYSPQGGSRPGSRLRDNRADYSTRSIGSRGGDEDDFDARRPASGLRSYVQPSGDSSSSTQRRGGDSSSAPQGGSRSYSGRGGNNNNNNNNNSSSSSYSRPGNATPISSSRPGATSDRPGSRGGSGGNSASSSVRRGGDRSDAPGGGGGHHVRNSPSTDNLLVRPPRN